MSKGSLLAVVVVGALASTRCRGCESAAPLEERGAPISTERLASEVESSPSRQGIGWTPERRQAARTLAVEFRRHLKQGRTLERRGNHAAAVAAFNKAVEVQPGNARALCELGWSALNAGDLVEAERALSKALRYLQDAGDSTGTPHASLLGMCLYNFGRVAEAKGASSEAVEAYRRSILARPNEVVGKRLASLAQSDAGAPPTEAPDEARPAFVTALAGPVEDLAAARAALLRLVCGGERVALAGAVSGRSVQACSASVVEEAGTWEEGPLLEAAVIRVTVQWEDVDSDDVAILALRSDAGWHLMPPALPSAYASNVAGMVAELDVVLLDARQVLRGTGRQVMLRLASVFTDSDLGIGEWEETRREALVFCGVDGGQVTCAAPLIVVESYRRDLFEGESPDPELGTPGLPIRRGYELSVAFSEPGVLTIGLSSGEGPLPAQMGSHSFESLRSPPWAATL